MARCSSFRLDLPPLFSLAPGALLSLAPEPLLGSLTPGQFIGALTQKSQLPSQSLRFTLGLGTNDWCVGAGRDRIQRSRLRLSLGLEVSPQRQLQRTRPDIVYPKRRTAGVSLYCQPIDHPLHSADQPQNITGPLFFGLVLCLSFNGDYSSFDPITVPRHPKRIVGGQRRPHRLLQQLVFACPRCRLTHHTRNGRWNRWSSLAA